MKFYIVMKDQADRPYVTSARPSRERQALMIDQGCELFEVEVDIPGWEWKHGRVTAVCEQMKVD